MKKGLSMPLELIVVIAVAVLVLVVVAAMFSGALGSGDRTLKLAKAFDDGCGKLRSVYNCDNDKINKVAINLDSKIDPSDNNIDNIYHLSEICAKKSLAWRTAATTGTLSECALACGCIR